MIPVNEVLMVGNENVILIYAMSVLHTRFVL